MAYKLRYDTTMGGTANINVPQWTGAPNANWTVIVTFIVTSIAASRAFLGRSSSSVGENRITTAGAINITYFGLNSAAGAVTVGTKVRVKIESVGTWKYLSVDTGSGFVQVGSIDYAGANSLIFDRLGRASTYHPYFDFFGIETIGGTYTDKWDSTTAPSTGTTWPSVGGTRNITLTNFIGTADSWWVFYDAGGGGAPAGPQRWNGSAHVPVTPKRWNGTAYVDAPLKRWSGAAFVDA